MIAYYVVKSNPSHGNELEYTLKPGVERVWWSRSAVARKLEKGDRVFMWEGTPSNYIIGLAEIIEKPEANLHDERETNYPIRYLTSAFEKKITKARLLENPLTADASFLKQGQVSGVVSLWSNEAEAIYQWICNEIPQDGVEDLWPDLL
jgi:hypothetical protein